MRLRALLVVVAVLAAGCSSAPTSAPAPAYELVTTGPATGALVAHGVVRRNGAPLAGATVTLRVVTDGVPRWSSPPATADQDGRWALKVDPASVPPSVFPAPRRYLDAVVAVADPTREATWSTTFWTRRPDGGWRTSGAGAGDGVVRLDADLGTGALSVTDSAGEKTSSTVVLHRPG